MCFIFMEIARSKTFFSFFVRQKFHVANIHLTFFFLRSTSAGMEEKQFIVQQMAEI